MINDPTQRAGEQGGNNSGAGATVPKSRTLRTINGKSYIFTQYYDGTYDLTPADTGEAGGGTGGGMTPYQSASLGSAEQSRQAQQQQAAADLQERIRQYNETFGMEKAKFNEQMAATEAQRQQQQKQFESGQELERGKTLLGLGSKPDTLLRYLYALRGLQPPQGVGQTTLQGLPGFSNITGGAIPGQPSSSPAGAAAGSPPQGAAASTPAASQAAAPVSVQPPPQGSQAMTGGLTFYGRGGQTSQQFGGAPGGFAGPGGTFIPGGQFGGFGGAGTYVGAAQQGGGPPPIGQVTPLATGGVIPEPVIGRGQFSGQMYSFGEKRPEAVVPSIGVNSYQQGGTIGYNPGVPNLPQPVVNGPSASTGAGATFNPPNLGNITGGTLPGGVPNIPGVGYATGGGQSLIPSQQRWNMLTPAEQQAYQGYLRDVAGVQPGDVESLSQRAMPSPYSGFSPLGRVVRGLSQSKYSS